MSRRSNQSVHSHASTTSMLSASPGPTKLHLNRRSVSPMSQHSAIVTLDASDTETGSRRSSRNSRGGNRRKGSSASERKSKTTSGGSSIEVVSTYLLSSTPRGSMVSSTSSCIQDDVPFAMLETGSGFSTTPSMLRPPAGVGVSTPKTTPKKAGSHARSSSVTSTPHTRVVSTLPTKDALRDSPEEVTDPEHERKKIARLVMIIAFLMFGMCIILLGGTLAMSEDIDEKVRRMNEVTLPPIISSTTSPPNVTEATNSSSTSSSLSSTGVNLLSSDQSERSVPTT